MAESVLIIDNDRALVRMLVRFFERRGFTAYGASNGAEGLALARAHRPDVIISDLLMEPVHGFEVLRQVRADPTLAGSLVILASAKAFRSDMERARQLGATDYLVKPFLPEDLLRLVRHHQALAAQRTVRVTFWGTRGSIATPGPATTRFGGNTACVEVRCGGEILIFDAGTGLRELGLALAREFDRRPLTVHLFISHTHWDHIQGFPFFLPAYHPATTIHIYGAAGQGRPLEKLLCGQMDPDYFPVALGDLAAALRVHEFRAEAFVIGETTVSAMYLNHPGMTLGYRVHHAGRTVVYATDTEPYRSTLARAGQQPAVGEAYGAELDRELVEFVTGADLYIGEAQYTDEEYREKVGWGHSSLSATVEVAVRGGVKALALFHHDPMHTDDVIAAMVETAQRQIAARGAALTCFAAYEGQTLDL